MMVDEKQTCRTCGGAKVIDVPFSSPPEKTKCRTCDGRGTEPVMTYHPGDEGQTGSSVSMQQVGQATMSGGRETPIFHATRGGTPTFTGNKMQGMFTRGNAMQIAWRVLKHGNR